jgi:hypothetical protein
MSIVSLLSCLVTQSFHQPYAGQHILPAGKHVPSFFGDILVKGIMAFSIYVVYGEIHIRLFHHLYIPGFYRIQIGPREADGALLGDEGKLGEVVPPISIDRGVDGTDGAAFELADRGDRVVDFQAPQAATKGL